jgi:hypothetical protein
MTEVLLAGDAGFKELPGDAAKGSLFAIGYQRTRSSLLGPEAQDEVMVLEGLGLARQVPLRLSATLSEWALIKMVPWYLT